MSDDPKRLRTIELFAWLGEDELGSGVVGLKQGLVPAGLIPLVATTIDKMHRAELMLAMHAQAALCGKKIYLCRFTFAEVLCETSDGTPLP